MSDSPQLDAQFMRRAIRLAMNGRGRVEPNPMVGCVIAKNGQIIGEGYHEQFGQPHAEPNALANCKESPQGATAYVTLEPCCHTNKKTPPCVPKLIEAKLARIVIGCNDPNPQVAGQGIAQLRAAGIVIDTPLLEAECKQLIAPFFARTVLKRPYVTLKWAQTADGKIAGPGGQRLQISNETSMRLVHALRSRCDAIMVGIRTVINDDPMLSVRDVPILRPLTRFVLDSALAIPLTSRLIASARQQPLVVLASIDVFRHEPSRVKALEKLGVLIEPVNMQGRHFPLEKVLTEIGCRGSTHLLVEPGPSLARSFADHTDRLWVFRSSRILNDSHAPHAAEIHYAPVGKLELNGDTLTEYLNPRSPLFFSPQPSADFLLSQP